MHNHHSAMRSPPAGCNDSAIAAVLRAMSPTQFQLLGATQMAYARPVALDDGVIAYAIHSADGTGLAIVGDFATGAELAGEHKMILLPVH